MTDAVIVGPKTLHDPGRLIARPAVALWTDHTQSQLEACDNAICHFAGRMSVFPAGQDAARRGEQEAGGGSAVKGAVAGLAAAARVLVFVGS